MRLPFRPSTVALYLPPVLTALALTALFILCLFGVGCVTRNRRDTEEDARVTASFYLSVTEARLAHVSTRLDSIERSIEELLAALARSESQPASRRP